MNDIARKLLVIALVASMTMCTTVFVSDDSDAAPAPTQSDKIKGTYEYQVWAGDSFRIELPFVAENYNGNGRPSWVNLESGEANKYLTGVAPTEVGTSVTFTMADGYMVSEFESDYDYYNIKITIIARPNIDFNDPGLTVTPDNNSRGQTYYVAENRAIRIMHGSYGFKMPGWWFTEVHETSLTGDLHGFQDQGDYYQGVLDHGTYTFTVDVGGKATFTFNIVVSEVSSTVNFDSEGGSNVGSVKYPWDGDLTLPSATYGTYRFDGWYTASGQRVGGAGDAFDPMTYNGQTLHAKWSSVVKLVTGDESFDVYIDIGEQYNLPTASKDGYVLSGWYTAPSGGSLVGTAGQSYVPLGDTILYAQFVPVLVWGAPSFSLGMTG